MKGRSPVLRAIGACGNPLGELAEEGFRRAYGPERE